MLRRVASTALTPLRAVAGALPRRCLTAAAAAAAPPIVPHRSDAQERIARVDVIEVDSDVALCDGGAWCSPLSRGPCSFSRARRPSFGAVPPLAGGGATGHPIEYIQLNKRAGPSPTACKYCGLRYVGTGHHH